MARGDVLLVAFPQSEHREQSGRRPAVAVQADATDQPMLIVVPITSNRKALRFKFAVSLDPTEENGLDLPSVAMVFQMRSVDRGYSKSLAGFQKLICRDLIRRSGRC